MQGVRARIHNTNESERFSAESQRHTTVARNFPKVDARPRLMITLYVEQTTASPSGSGYLDTDNSFSRRTFSKRPVN